MRGVRDSIWPFCLGAVQRPDARPDPSAGSWVRALVCSARRAAQCYGGKVRRPATLLPSSPTTTATRTVRGFMGLRAAPPAPASSPPKRVSPHMLSWLPAAGGVDPHSDITADKWKTHAPAVPPPPLPPPPPHPPTPPP